MDLARRANETALDYHRRLIEGKLVDKTLSDVDYTELAEYIYGQAYSSDVARRMMYGSKRTLDLVDAEPAKEKTASGLADELDRKRIELMKERQRFFDQRSAYNKMIREQAREDELKEIIERTLKSGALPELKYDSAVVRPDSGGTLLVSLNDLHYGANFVNAWGRYNSSICAAMMRKYLAEILRIDCTHLCGDCVVWAAGDMISGSIHRSIQVTNKENVIEQIMGVSELIAECLAELGAHFRTVRFVSVAGNHSRIEPNKDNSLTAERLDDLVEWYLSARLQNLENVRIDDGHKMDNTISVFDIEGKTYCMVHGDFDGSAGKIQDLQAMVGRPLYAVLCGHLHHNQTNTVQGIRTVMAGSFQGMDSFCVEKRIVGRPEQMVCVCNENGIVCHYDIPLDGN